MLYISGLKIRGHRAKNIQNILISYLITLYQLQWLLTLIWDDLVQWTWDGEEAINSLTSSIHLGRLGQIMKNCYQDTRYSDQDSNRTLHEYKWEVLSLQSCYSTISLHIHCTGNFLTESFPIPTILNASCVKYFQLRHKHHGMCHQWNYIVSQPTRSDSLWCIHSSQFSLVLWSSCFPQMHFNFFHLPRCMTTGDSGSGGMWCHKECGPMEQCPIQSVHSMVSGISKPNLRPNQPTHMSFQSGDACLTRSTHKTCNAVGG
jgi:hypothetical protein